MAAVRYHCSACGLAVLVLRGPDGVRVVRACSCAGAIVADMRADLGGRGGVRG